MDLKLMQKNIQARQLIHSEFVRRAEEGERYYRCENDILTKPLLGEDPNNPRTAIHRIPSSYFKMLVDEIRSYFAGKDTQIDTGDKKLNEEIMKIAGRKFGQQLRRACTDASTTGRGVWHLWKTGVDPDKTDDKTESKKQEFKFHAVDPKQIEPVWGGALDQELVAVWRHYEYIDMEGKAWELHEWWDKEFCYAYRKPKEPSGLDNLMSFNKFMYWDVGSQEWKPTNKYKHGFDRVPFIIFKNNPEELNDLVGIKALIDAYDEVVTEFWDDLADFQEAIWVLSGYGKEPPDDFLRRLKQNKLIKLESGYPDGVDPSLETISVEIPTDARQLGMETAHNAIFEQGMGIGKTQDNLTNTSGEALKYRNILIELKASIKQDGFENGLIIFFKEIAKFLGKDLNSNDIEIRWTRNKIDNDTELMNNARLCLGFTSLRTALKVNPYVENVDEEMEQIKKEREEEMKEAMRSFGDMDMLRQTSSFSKNVQSSQERVLNQRQAENKSTSQEKYRVGKAVSGRKSGWGN